MSQETGQVLIFVDCIHILADGTEGPDPIFVDEKYGNPNFEPGLGLWTGSPVKYASM